MPRLDSATRNIAIGRLQAGESQNEVTRTLNVNQSTISRLWNRFQQTGSTNDRQRNGRPRIATPGQDRYIRVFHLRNRTVAASTTAARIPGLRRIGSQTVRNWLRKHGIRPSIDAVAQMWKSPLVQIIKGLDIPKLAKNLVQRRVSFSAAETWRQNTCI
jgi:transposase